MGEGIEMLIGAKLNDKRIEKVTRKLAPHLLPGESISALVRTNKFKPMLDTVVVTNARVLALGSEDGKGPKVSIAANEIDGVDLAEKRFANPSIAIVTTFGKSVSLGTLIGDNADGPLLRDAILALRYAGLPPHFDDALAERNTAAAELGTDSSAGSPPPEPTATLATTTSGGLADELAKLSRLHESGALTADEFGAAKAAAIARAASS
jgi:hypothetical protein